METSALSVSGIPVRCGVPSHNIDWHDYDLVVDQGSEHKEEKCEELGPVELLLLGGKTDDPNEKSAARVDGGALGSRGVFGNTHTGCVEARDGADDADGHPHEGWVGGELLEGKERVFDLASVTAYAGRGALNVLEDWQENTEIDATKETLTTHDKEWIQIVPIKQFFLRDELSTGKALCQD